MGAFRTDPSITARGVAPAFDPIAAMSRIANLRRLQQRGQINQQQLEDMERERERQQAIRGAVGAGGSRADMLRRLQQDAPLAGLDLKERFAKQDFQAAQTRKSQLENSKATYGLIGQLAGPLDFLEQQGADIETLQVAYADSLGKLADAGIDTSKLPQEYKPGMARQAMMEAVTEKDRIDQALRAEEAAERKVAREKKFPGRDVPFSPEVEAQKKRISAARRTEKPPSQSGKALAERTKQRAMERAEDEYRKKLKALEKDWEYEPEGVDDEGNVVGLWFQRQSGLKITNDEMLELRQQAEEDLISDKEQADESYLAQLEALGFEPGEPVDYRKQRGGRKGQDPLGLFP